ncbi:glycopeptide resistance accessory protein VanW [Ihubacter sp. rT4E-8]|uniref:glycopeptide resistance accessory protein VanW n=1 Tax=Ihubacter sp. rT4E-8 TaxID=3242369 RepID=UPI003CF7B6A8
MSRKRITERFPWLLPLRQTQRKIFFYAGMRLDRNTYAKTQRKGLMPSQIISKSEPMINRDSGYDIQYQYNKVHNLKLAAAKLHGLLIKPGETFSFCLSVKKADKETPYKDGLSLVDGKIQGEYGGGLCQLSNLLYWLFLHTQLTIVERHGHGTEAVTPADPDMLAGIDATIAEGWLDLKVKNETSHVYQLAFHFDEDVICGEILADTNRCYDYTLYNPLRQYILREGQIIEEATLARKRTSLFTGAVDEEILYRNTCVIEYPLPESTVIKEGV